MDRSSSPDLMDSTSDFLSPHEGKVVRCWSRFIEVEVK